MNENKLELRIGLDGVSCIDFTTVNNDTLFAIGTCEGRVRIYNYQNYSNSLYQKRWHKTIRCLSFFPTTPNYLVTASSQSGLKIHDINCEKRIWMQLHAHEKSPITSVLVLQYNQWATGDENGIIKLWDARKSGSVAVLKPTEANIFDDQFSAINEMAISSDSYGLLLAAVDDGSLATFNIRRRRFEMVSETLGFSARTVTIVKNGQKVLVGTDEGVISVFNWNEFGNICDRFPVHPLRPSKHGQARTATSGIHSVEKITKITEDVIAVATDDGVISAMNILPNRLLGSIGCHNDTVHNTEFGADCITLAYCPTNNMIGSACPTNSTVKFWSTINFIKQAKHQESDLRLPKKYRKLEITKLKGIKARKLLLADTQSRTEYLSGLLPEKSNNFGDNSSISNDDSTDEDEHSDTSGNNSSGIDT